MTDRGRDWRERLDGWLEPFLAAPPLSFADSIVSFFDSHET